MPILSNTPTIRYITIRNLVIKDSNIYYPIITIETNKKYIYWDKNSPYKLICEDEMLEDRANLYLLVINKKGNFTIANQDLISVNFDEDIKLDGFNNKLNATVEKVGEHTETFINVTKDIYGINETVGTITEDLKNTNAKYDDDKELNSLRESIAILLIDQNVLLMGFNSSIKDIARDNNFTEEEKTKIKDTQFEITNKNDLLIIEVEKLVSILGKEDITDKLKQLASIKEEYTNSFNLLNSTLTSLISGNLITQTQITILINCISNVSTKLTKLKNICDDIIFLGAGGALYEEISKINITSEGLKTTISKKVGKDEVISSINKTVESVKIDANKINLNDYVTMTNLSQVIQEQDEKIKNLEEKIAKLETLL